MHCERPTLDVLACSSINDLDKSERHEATDNLARAIEIVRQWDEAELEPDQVMHSLVRKRLG